ALASDPARTRVFARPRRQPIEPPDPPAAAAADPFAVDNRGFVDSDARCDDGQTAVAVGRTPASLVVICGDRTGWYGYLGVRLSADAVLNTVARSTSTHEFIARNASATYSIFRAGLRGTAGDAVIKQE